MSLSLHELSVGASIPTFVDQPLSRTDFVRYQGASGDMNPVHHDDEFARSVGYPSVFAVGMMTAGILATYVAELFDPERIRRFSVRFQSQAWPGDVLSYSGAVVAIRPGPDGTRMLDLDLVVTNQEGQTHLTGAATFRLD